MWRRINLPTRESQVELFNVEEVVEEEEVGVENNQFDLGSIDFNTLDCSHFIYFSHFKNVIIFHVIICQKYKVCSIVEKKFDFIA